MVDRSEFEQFGGELFRLRTLKRSTQAAIASRAGLKRGYYSQLENSRKTPPPLRTVRLLANALELNLEQQSKLELLAIVDRCCEALKSEELSPAIIAPIREFLLAENRSSPTKTRRTERR